MTNSEILFVSIIIMLLVVFWSISCCLLVLEREKNKDMQKENSDLIDRNLQLQKESKKSDKNMNYALSKLADKIKLLNDQDKIIKELNELLKVSGRAIAKYQTKDK